MRFEVWMAAFPWVLAAAQAGAAPGSPSLPSTADDYVGYAVTNLPTQFRQNLGPLGAIDRADNTPADNPITNDGAALGRALFYDPRLSHDNGTSCASCHQQSAGFSDPAAKSTGFEGQQTARHSMGLSNAKFYAPGSFFWDQRAATLEDQVLQPIESPVEMGETLSNVVAKLGQTEFYPELFERAFGDRTITADRMSKAMAQFVRSMVSYQSKYDSAFNQAGVPNFAATLTAEEERGRQLFHGGGRCGGCHGTDAQIASTTHNIGLDATNTDEGAGDGEFKVPSLRNIAVRGTFMHDGRFSSLEEVIRFYSTGIQNNPDLDPTLRNGQGQPIRLNFSPQQVSDLAAFLRTLTDETLLTSALFSDPFVTLPGDYNSDGLVDQDDYTVWRESFGFDSDLSADGNGDFVIDAADYTVWRDNLGRSWLDLAQGAGFASESVPEPSSWLLMGALLLTGAAARRKLSTRS